MGETINVYDALTALEIDPATLATTVTQQKGFDYGAPDVRFNAIGQPVKTYIGQPVAQPMMYQSINATLTQLGLTGNEPVIQFILTMIEAAKAAQSGQG